MATDAAALAAQLDVLRKFMADHPEVARELGVTNVDAPPPGPPLHVSDLFHALIAHIPGIDDERREQFHGVVDAHFAPADDEQPAAGGADVPRETSAPNVHVARADPALALTDPAPAPAAPAVPTAAAPVAPAPASTGADDLPGA